MNTKLELKKMIVKLGEILKQMDIEGSDMRDGSAYDRILEEMKRVRDLLDREENSEVK